MTFNHPISSKPKPFDGHAKFSILIPSWNNLELLKLCINSIEKNSAFLHQIIIHINEGTDGSLPWVEANNYSYTFSEKNVGVCYAMNALAKLANCDYLLYLNDDMYVCPNWDKVLVEAIEALGHNAFYYSATMIEPTISRNKCVVAPYNFGSTPDNFNEEKLLDFAKTVKKSDWFGASWPPAVVHRQFWDKIDGYSVEFSPGFGSDPDFSMKLWQAGVREFRGFGKSLVYHFQSKSTGKVTKNDGRYQFAKKWRVPISFFYRNVLRLGQAIDSKPLKWPKGPGHLFARLRAWQITRKNFS